MNLNAGRRSFTGFTSLFAMKRTGARAVRSPWRKLWAVALLGLSLVSIASAQDAADNVVIILDGSGSMGAPLPGANTDKMTAAKAALKQVLQSVPESTRIGLLVFSAKGVNNDWVYPLGPRDDARLMAAIDRPIPNGGTPLGAYLKKGADRLLEERARQYGYGTFRLLVVTDGEAQDQPLVEQYTPEIIARGITVDVIGVAMNQRHTLATRVHSYRSADDPTSLKRAIAEVFGEIGGHGDDVSSAEAFAELAPIPVGVAQAMIQALASSGNQPIGLRSPGATTSSPSAVRAPASPFPAQPARVRAPSSRGGFVPFLSVLSGLLCIGVVGLVLLTLLIRAAKKSRR